MLPVRFEECHNLKKVVLIRLLEFINELEITVQRWLSILPIIRWLSILPIIRIHLKRTRGSIVSVEGTIPGIVTSLGIR